MISVVLLRDLRGEGFKVSAYMVNICGSGLQGPDASHGDPMIKYRNSVALPSSKQLFTSESGACIHLTVQFNEVSIVNN